MGDWMLEGAFSARPPLLDSGNYTFWRNTMKAYIRAINDKSWMNVSDVVEEEKSLNDRESTSNYIAHVAIYEGRFEIVVKTHQVMRKVKTLQVVKIVKSPPMMKS